MEATTKLGKFLAKIAGENVTTPEPTNEMEFYLDKVAKNTAGGFLKCNVFTEENADPEPFGYLDKTVDDILAADLLAYIRAEKFNTNTIAFCGGIEQTNDGVIMYEVSFMPIGGGDPVVWYAPSTSAQIRSYPYTLPSEDNGGDNGGDDDPGGTMMA